MSFQHISVLLHEAIEALNINKDGVYVDCTLGGAGHSSLILSRLSAKGRLIGIDQDELAINEAKKRLQDALPKVTLVRDNFGNLNQVLADLKIDKVDGILMDIGVSSPQIDDAERGFSYIKDAPIDMRMDRRQALNGEVIVNNYSASELSQIFYEYGEERWGKRIAEFIVKERAISPIKTTSELVKIIDKAIPKEVRQRQSGHPAKRVFQAIRIAVNDELGVLERVLDVSSARLKAGGRLVVITFHSLEDRIVKNKLKALTTACICPPKVPICICRHKAVLKNIGKSIKPSPAEIAANQRAKSATLRIAEKL